MTTYNQETLKIKHHQLLKKVLLLKLLAIILSTLGLYFTYRYYSAYGLNEPFFNRAFITIGLPLAYMLFVKFKTDNIKRSMEEIRAQIKRFG
jgi:FtsH-binding integral membrane protein